jgi:hypothetical protein
MLLLNGGTDPSIIGHSTAPNILASDFFDDFEVDAVELSISWNRLSFFS